MITKWHLSNFKSVRSADLEFGPLTIFSGPNSSGKSTCLQSLLLVTQTLSSKVSSHSVVLNGPIMRLGQFDDLASSNSDSNQIGIGWECQPKPDRLFDQDRPASHIGTGAYWPAHEQLTNVKSSVSFEVHGAAATELTQLQPTLANCRIECATTIDPASPLISWIDISRSKMPLRGPGGKAAKMQTPDELAASLGFEYDVNLDPESQQEIRDELTSGHTVGATLRHFLPTTLAVRFNILEEEVSQIRTALFLDTRRIRPRYYAGRDATIPAPVMSILQKELGDVAPQLFSPVATDRQRALLPPPAPTVRQFTDRFRRLPPGRLAEVRKRLAELQPTLTQVIEDTVKGGRSVQYALTQMPVPTPVNAGVAYLDSFFSRGVKYLGPLRDEPKPLYPLAGSVDPADVGFRGEHTAAVLDLHRHRTITYIPSAGFAELRLESSVRQAGLAEAIQDWTTYMGVADGFQTRDLGKLGHELKVVSQGVAAPQDLTHVGVGVSQVLPILVLCLLADPDTTIIIEQPELHLHPRVQTLLADFFLSMAILGKQCLIETHSEYIINRLRLRAAMAEGAHVSSLLKVYFVEKIAGASTFRDVEISKYGSIPEWPDGFFDQSQSEAESILLAATAKRQLERSAE